MSFKLSHFDIFTESFYETKNRSGLPTIYVKEAIFSHSLLTTQRVELSQTDIHS